SEPTRSFFESRFHHDFSLVRIHANSEAAESARALEATAYTVGHHLVFGAGEYSPGTPAGKKLLAHELTHVVQQPDTSPSAAQRQTRTGVPPAPAPLGLVPQPRPAGADCGASATRTFESQPQALQDTLTNSYGADASAWFARLGSLRYAL